MDRSKPAYRTEADMTLPPLLIRADASTEIGTGHVMRCLALAQAWQDKGGGVTYCCATLPQTLHTRLVTEQITVRRLDAMAGSANDAESVIALAREIGAEAVVVDGYVFGSEYQKLIKNAGLRLLFIDDYGHAEHYYADFVLNQNAHADTITYVNRESNTQLLLGTRYALLRREFWPWRGRKRPTVPQANKLLVTMGGSDPDNITMRLLDKLTSILDDKAVHIKTVVGGSNPHLDSLLLRANREHGRIDILQN
ncbi:MAG: UDP-2,4-diacetamido-2,4,6-trideoxy-beta-L-altropyranose hydrolase, partial [Phototrophicaceae bacterium]